jgi:large subunit ribosomal protein L21
MLMYAIVKTGGKQYRVEPGQRLLIERLAAKEGSAVSLEPIMYRAEETVLDAAALKDVKVSARVLEHVRGEKLRVFKFKPKRGYRRRTGHRQALTRIEVTEITAGAKGKAPPQAKVKAPADTEAKAATGEKPPASAKAAPKPKAAAGRAKAPAKPKAPVKAKAPAKPKAPREEASGEKAKED